MDELILRRAQKGDASAFEQLVTPYEQMIWRVCWHYLHHREDAMDCAQEVMLKAWRSIGQYRQDCGFSSWLYRIAGSVCIDFLRKQKRMVDSDSMDAMAENGFEPADDSPTPEAAARLRIHRRYFPRHRPASRRHAHRRHPLRAGKAALRGYCADYGRIRRHGEEPTQPRTAETCRHSCQSAGTKRKIKRLTE